MTNNTDRLLDHIFFLARRLCGCERKCVIMTVLLELGITPQYDGYAYLLHLVKLYMDAPGQVAVNSLYAALSALYNETVDANQIEQSVRSVIRRAWQNRDDRVWGLYFPILDNGEIRKPSNTEAISLIACVVDIWKGCCTTLNTEGHTEEEL